MKRHISIFTLLLGAFAAVGPAGSARGTERIFGEFVSLAGTWKTGDKERISPAYASLERNGSQVFEVNPPSGYKVTKWLWFDNYSEMSRKGENDMEEITGSGEMRWVSSDLKTCTVMYSADGSRALGVRFDYMPLEVTFNGNGSTSGSMSKITGKNIDSSFTLAANGYVKTGYQFLGWTNRVGTAFSDGATVKGSDFWNAATRSFDSTLYAKWGANVITVSYDANEGKYSDNTTVKSKSVKFDGTYGNPPDTPSRGGYTFKRWQAKADGGTEIKPDTKVNVPSNHTVYACWESVGPLRINVSCEALDQDKRASGSVTGGDSYAWGEKCVLQATPSTGSKFIRWKDNETENPRSFTVTAAGTYTACFDLES